MRAVVQRVLSAHVDVAGDRIGSIDRGLCVLLGCGDGDNDADLVYITDKLANLRIFEDDGGKMNLSVRDVAGGILLVSQFTLYGDARKGRRPTFTSALEPTTAKEYCDRAAQRLRELGILRVDTGRFGADMQVSLVNDGPVTILLDSSKQF